MIGMWNSLCHLSFAICHLPFALLPSIFRIQESGRLTSGIPLVIDGTKTR